MSDVIEHTEKEFDEALREELEGDVLVRLGIVGSPESPRPSSPEYPPGIKLFRSPRYWLWQDYVRHRQLSRLKSLSKRRRTILVP